jgi:hypothetical protein
MASIRSGTSLRLARRGGMSRYTIPAVAALTLHLAGCDKSQIPAQPQAAHAAAIAPESRPAVAALTAKPAGTLPGPTDRDPTHALAYWRAAMEGRDWAAARSVYGDFGAQSGQTAQAFAAAWDKYRIVDVTVGTGDQEGGAGSSYYDVPVTITGLTKASKPYHLAGQLTLRRVNDVDGASPEQLRWHIERSTLQP